MNENIYKQPLVLFLGAGASLDLGMKTTVGFFEWLQYQQRIEYALLTSTAILIEASKEVGSKPDVEAVLDRLGKVIEGAEILESHGHRAQFIGYKLADYVKVRDQIKDLVVSHYSGIEPKRAFKLYHPLLELASLQPLPVFTTNYDLALEKAYEFTSASSYDLREAPFSLIDGFRRQGRVVTPEWSSSAYEDYEPTGADVILFKLHGSVDWVRTPRGAIQRVESGQRNPGGMPTVIAYPSRLKREIHEEPFRTNYDYLLACLLHARVCAVIGFSFRDLEIVEELRQAMELNKDLHLMIIDPHAAAIETHLEDKLGFRPKADLLEGEFNVEGAPYIAKTIKATLEWV